jgi:hypothetical protein
MQKYGGMTLNELKRMNELEQGNAEEDSGGKWLGNQSLEMEIIKGLLWC